jgi:hypothetical protein
MASVTFVHRGRSITVDAPADRAWRAAHTGQAGQATISLQRGSAALSSTYINPDTGSAVLIHDEAGCGVWRGIVTDIGVDGYQTLVSAVQPFQLLGRRIVQTSQTLRHLTPGAAMTLACGMALDGVQVLSTRYTHEGGGVDVGTFAPGGSDLWRVLNDLMLYSDGEVHVDEDGVVLWVGPLAYGTRRTELLIAGGNLSNFQYQTSGGDRVAEVISSGTYGTYTARRGEVAAGGWPAQSAITGDPGLAEAEAHRRALPQVRISGTVNPLRWYLRERDYVRVVVPRARFTGATHTCRVLARSISDRDRVMTLELQVIPSQTPPQIPSYAGAGGRMPPPQRPNEDGSGGSPSQQQQELIRRTRRGAREWTVQI